MSLRILWLFLAVSVKIYTAASVTNDQDSAALTSLRSIWKNTPPNWVGSDPCGNGWVGIGCTGTHVTSITLASVNLGGYLSGDIASFSELLTLDLSYNQDLTGSIPPAIGNLKKLKSLSLIGCSFTGSIPNSIGSLRQLKYLSLNSNGFTGKIPPSIGNLLDIYWLDLADNQLEGLIPVSNGTTPGLDLLVNTKHFHFGKNKLSGDIPPQLFNSQMTLIHVLFESNKLTGTLPSSLGYVQSLEVVRFDNNSLVGRLPANLKNLTAVHDLYLSNNKFSGLLPTIAGMNNLNTLDLSNNSFGASDLSSWFSNLRNLPALTTLTMQNTQLSGQVPVNLFSLPHLQTVQLSDNQLNGTLDIGTSYSNGLRIINLQTNFITEFNESTGVDKIEVVLVGNPVCGETTGTTKSYCQLPQPNSSLYSTPPKTCTPMECSSNQIASPMCRCAYPYMGVLHFRALFFSDYGNPAPYASLEGSLMNFFSSQQYPVDSVSVSNPRMDPYNYFLLNISIFPYGQDRFNRSGVSSIAFVFSNQTYKPPNDFFGPYVFSGDLYPCFSDAHKSSKTSVGIIVGAVAGGSILLLLVALAGVYAYRQKQRAERLTKESNPFASWDVKNSSGSVPQLKGARFFSFEEVKKYTNNFSESNDIGSGGYGKVYRGTLPTGELVAIKRAQHGSMQGGLEFKTEIELLSRVHHKNVVGLIGFCFERGEQMLIYEYIPNGSLYETLSGKSGIRLDWARRLKIALGAARGLSYLHELANPPIIHRDIKSTNILLDERLNAKVADFGLSKPVGDIEKGHVTTQVKGTMGYLDPEYYMTQQLTEKSDVYSFGVLMLEIITGRRPIERGKYIVREVRMNLDRTKSLYNLHQILDPSLGTGAQLKGVERFADLAMSCVEESGSDRPTMGNVVKEIESIMQLAGMNPNAESATSSSSYEEATKGSLHPYGGEDSFAYSAAYSVAKLEPH